MKLSFFTRLFSQTIQNRGKIYWQHGRVNVTSFDGKTYTATVKGMRDYTTKVTLNGDEIVSSSCDCPYGSNCKHVAALMFEIRERNKNNKEVLDAPPPQKEEKVKEDKVYPPIEIQGSTLEAKEFFLLCAITYAGSLDYVNFTTVPVSISRSWKFPGWEYDRLANALYDKQLIRKVSARYFFENDNYYMQNHLYFEVMGKMMAEYEPWLNFFQKKLNQRSTASYLFSVAQEFFGKKKPRRVPSTLFGRDYAEMSNVQIAIFTLLKKENAAAKLCAILEDDVLCPIIKTLTVQAMTNEDTGSTSLAREYLAHVTEDSKEWAKTSALLQLTDYIVKGEWTDTPPTRQMSTCHHYMWGIRCLYEGKVDESIKEFQAGLSKNKGIEQWKHIPDIPVAALCYTMALGSRRTAVDVQRLRKMLSYKDSLMCRSQSSIFALVNFFQDNRQPKETKMLTECLDEYCQLVGKDNQAIAHLLLHFFGKAGEYTGGMPGTQIALLQKELSEYGVCEAGAWPYEAILCRMKTREFWELELEDLIQTVCPEQKADKEKEPEKAPATGRLCYLTDGERITEVREQGRLKSGAWGKGKKLSFVRYESINALTDDTDMQIHNEWKRKEWRTARHYMYYPTLELILPYLRGTDKLMDGRKPSPTPISVREEKPFLYTERQGQDIVLAGNFPLTAHRLNNMMLDMGNPNEWVYYPMDQKVQALVTRLLGIRKVPQQAEPMLERLFEGMKGQVDIQSEIAGAMELRKVEGQTALALRVTPEGEAFRVLLTLCPLPGGTYHVFPGEGNSSLYETLDGERVEVVRHPRKERQVLKEFNELFTERVADEPFDKQQPDKVLDILQMLDLLDLADGHERLFALEWPEGEALKVKRAVPSEWSLTATTQGGWFELEGEIPITDDHVLSMAQLLRLLRESQGGYIRLGKNEFVQLDASLRRQLQRIDAMAQETGGGIRIPGLAMAVAGDGLQGDIEISEPQQLADMRHRIRQSERMEVRIPEGLHATLRDYQEDGFRWMMRMMHWGAGVCLADDMGLGKTLQTIACLLAHAAEGPQMVVAPASVVSNWEREVERFAPSLHVVLANAYVSGDRQQYLENLKEGDVLLLTYGLLVSEGETLTQRQWTTVCLDEAHTIKNRDTKSSSVAMQLKADNRIILTGTPIQNHLGELWNLMQFINPGLLGSYEHFTNRFINPIQAGEEEPRLQLKRMIAPFMLRRTKQQVVRELPDKEDIMVPVKMSHDEMAIYEVIRREAKEELETVGTVNVNTLAMITKLREAACSASLVEKTWKGTSSKLEVLVDKLTQMVEQGNRVLIFSQFTSFLELACKALEEAGIKDYFYLNGSTPLRQRQQMVEDFQKGDKQVFLISLKAGGLGLNLTGANYVIHLDPWWNPAIEQQATDRAYRIGQKQKVTVYHLIAEHTIEEKILRLHHTKQSLADSLLEGTDVSHKLTANDLLELLG